ncbi:MAG: hypothetical protein V1708_02965 [Candidatus Micrarchaeota archaeon]
MGGLAPDRFLDVWLDFSPQRVTPANPSALFTGVSYGEHRLYLKDPAYTPFCGDIQTITVERGCDDVFQLDAGLCR